MKQKVKAKPIFPNKKVEVTKEEKEMLQQSNYIEREYGKIAMNDAVMAWGFAKQFKETLSVSHVLHIHKLLMSRLRPDIAGLPRNCAVWIGGRYCPAELPFVLEQKIQNWIDLYYVNPEATEEEIKEAHVKFEKLHPFEDGNGRVGRIIYNIQRLKNGLPVHIIHEGEEQLEYYKWFRE